MISSSHTKPKKSLGLAFNPYHIPVSSTRTGPIFQVHPYPTKINYRGIIPFILAHTKPGDVVYDCFAGTCSTGIAAAACVKPDESVLSNLDSTAKANVKWGPRRAICVDIGVLPTFVSRTLLDPVDIGTFEEVFKKIMNDVERHWGWIYTTKDDDGKIGTIRYTYYTNVILCDKCQTGFNFIDTFVDFEKGEFKSESPCPKCGAIIKAKNAKHATLKIYDRLLKTTRTVVKRVPAKVYGATGKRQWVRDATKADITALKKIEKAPLPSWIKAVPMLSGKPRWGEMYRAGYHRDVTHVHHFYTPRNFLALAILHDVARRIPVEFRNHFLLLLSSYNAAHSTLMTRFVFKRGSNRPVNTSAQPGALYINNCPVEKNVFRGVRQKFGDLVDAVSAIGKWKSDVKVLTRPAQQCGLRHNSVDYIFTDPPFGYNIQYSELNFLSETWLGSFTDSKLETIISKSQGKSLLEYETLLRDAFRENFRVLKPGRFMTVVFHSTQKDIWNSLRRAIIEAGFEIVATSILNKEQTSFKQTTTAGAVKKDLVIVAKKPIRNSSMGRNGHAKTAEQFLRDRLSSIGEESADERTFDYLFSRYVGFCIASGNDILMDAREFRQVLKKIAKVRDGKWYLRKESL